MGAKFTYFIPGGTGSSANWVNCAGDSFCLGEYTWEGQTMGAITDLENTTRCC